MKDLKNLFKLVWKRFSVWIILLTILTLLLNGLSARDQIKRNEDILENLVVSMAKDVGEKAPKSDGKFDEKYIEESKKIFDKFQKKYKLHFTEADEDGYFPGFFEEDDPSIDYEKVSLANNFKQAMHFISEKGIANNYYNANLFAPLVFFVSVIGFLITSMEQSFPYYEFTTMLPWKKRDEVWMKALIVFGLGLGLFLVNLFVSSLTLGTSNLSNIAGTPSIGNIAGKLILTMFGTSILVVSTGMIAGNFLGHIGMMIVALGGFELIWQNIRVIISIFSPAFDENLLFNLDQKFERFLTNIPEITKPFISITHTKEEYAYLFGFIIVAILWAVLAYFVSQKLSGEKSGYMIISNPIEKFVKILAILSFTSLFYVIISDTIVGINSIPLDLAIYILGLLISIKLFDILFKIRLKF